MGNVVLVEVFTVVRGLQPELPESLALRVRTNDAIGANEASESNTVETFGIENGSGVANTFCQI